LQLSESFLIRRAFQQYSLAIEWVFFSSFDPVATLNSANLTNPAQNEDFGE
jgi:hypothetical protein